MSIRAACLLLPVWALLLCVCLPETGNGQQPNVVVFLSDDQGWGDFSINGNRDLSTPNIDSLAKNGVSFENFYVCPVCSPTRAEFLTGRFHVRGGVYSTSAGGERLDLDERTIAEAFDEAGYATAAFGKWHNGMQFPYHPTARGFDHFYGFCSGHWAHYFSPMLEENGRIVRGNGYVVDDFTDQAIAFMERNRSRPFFVYLPYNTPHSPMQVPDKYWERFAEKTITQRASKPKQENLPHTRAALAMCENIDWNVGRVLKRLDELDLADNTIVIYFCDNGPNGARWNGGMRGRKGSTDEGGVRSPLFVRWPARLKPNRNITQIASVRDLFPTLAAICGVDANPKPGKPFDGKDISPLLFGVDQNWPDRILINNWKNKISARTQRFRLDNKGQLYDIVADRGQQTRVNRQFPAVAKRLQSAVEKWKNDVLSELDLDVDPFTVGHPSSVWTQLPARDAQPTGEIKRSGRFPNSSFFQNWKNEKDTIWFPVEVLTAGKYQVQLYYTCAKQDVGCVIELRQGDTKISRTIENAFDPPIKRPEFDRVERIESYTKEFKDIDMGTIDLSKGIGKLVLSAPSIPGDQAIDFRMLMLKRLD